MLGEECGGAFIGAARMGAEHDHHFIDGGLLVEFFEAAGDSLRRTSKGTVRVHVEDRLLVRRRIICRDFLG